MISNRELIGNRIHADMTCYNHRLTDGGKDCFCVTEELWRETAPQNTTSAHAHRKTGNEYNWRLRTLPGSFCHALRDITLFTPQ